MAAAYDLVVVGAGGGGLAAALSARRAGASVLLVEAGDSIGGTYAYSSGLLWLPGNTQAARDGIQDDPAEASNHVLRLSGGRASPAHLEKYLSSGPGVLAFLEEEGVPFEWIPSYPDYFAEEEGGKEEGRYLSSPVFFPRDALPADLVPHVHQSPYYRGLPVSWREIQEWGGYATAASWDQGLLAERRQRGAVGFGGATTGYLAAAAIRAGVEIRLNARVVALLHKNRSDIRGVSVESGGSVSEVSARAGVVLACGGYDHDHEMQRRLDSHAAAVPFGYRHVDGLALRLALDLGAAFVNLGGQLLAPAYEVPETGTHNIAAREAAFPGGIVVNRTGRRFADDSFYWALGRQMGAFDPASSSFRNLPAFLIFDEEWRNTYRLGPLSIKEEVPPWIATGDNATELAQKIGVDPASLRSTIEAYNETAEHGDDPEYQRGKTAYARNQGDHRVGQNPCVRPLLGRLYGLRLTLGSMGTLSGLKTDADARVLRNDGSPMAGLYACGNAMANEVEGRWYTSGTSNGRGLIFGRIAALHALQ